MSGFIFQSRLIDAAGEPRGEKQVSIALFTTTACSDSDALRTTRHYRVLDWAHLKDGVFTARANCPTVSVHFCKHSHIMYKRSDKGNSTNNVTKDYVFIVQWCHYIPVRGKIT